MVSKKDEKKRAKDSVVIVKRGRREKGGASVWKTGSFYQYLFDWVW